MKDKQRFMSSVIVSLLAGFIYYQFGQDIQHNFERSINAVLSSNDIEEYLPADCESFNSAVKKSGDSKVIKKKSKFFIKKNTIEFKSNNEVIAGEELFSEFVSGKQASFRRSVPDKNIDFTAELEKLIKVDDSEDLKPGKEFKANKSYNEDQVADTRGLRSSSNLLHKDFDVKSKHYRGNGFEYNYMTNENSKGKSSNGTGSSNSHYQSGNTYEYNTSYDDNTSYEYTEQKIECKKYKKECSNKVKVIVPKIEVRINTGNELMEVEIPEISIPDEMSAPEENEDSCEETM